jgi:PAS domain S-box-containing protein
MRAEARMLADAAGQPARFVGATMDITERREREALLAASRERLRGALAAGGLVDWEWRLDEARTRWGERRETILGPLPDALDDYPELRDMVHPEDLERFLAASREALDGGKPYRCDFRIIRPDGSLRWIKSEGAFEASPRDGLPPRLIGVAQDVTERVVGGEKLRESETRYRAVLETTTDTVIMVDSQNRIEYANPAVRTLLGWSPEDLAGQTLDVLQPPAMRAAQRRGIRRALQSNEPQRRLAEFTGLAKDGHAVPIEAVFSRIDAPGRRYFVGFLRDITRRKQYEAALREANATLERRVAERTAELQAVNRELEAFSYTVAHDLRAPLRAVDGFSRVLEEDLGPNLDSESRRYMSRIRTNTKVMAQMIDELLEFSRIGRAELNLRPVDLGTLVAAIAEELAVAWPRARVSCAPLPQVSGDPTLLRVVMSNLLGNALKFSSRRDDSQVLVDCRDAGEQVEIRVRDNGVGFDPAFSAKLFGVFQRLHSQQEFEGTGIGLATVARIVARHGGQVRAHSIPGEGATFSFTIARHRP